MKISFSLIACICFLQAMAGEFINLDLESVNESAVVGEIGPNGYLGGLGPVEELLPGWKLTFYDSSPPTSNEADRITFNATSCFGAPCASIVSREAYSDAAGYFLGLMTGSYAFLFDVGAIPSDYSILLSQRGDVPPGATALDLQLALPGARVEVRLDGTLVYEKILLDPPRIQDISAFTGKTVDLEILFLPAFGLGRSGGGLDKVRFVMGPSDTGLRIFKTPFFNDPPQQLTLQFTAVVGRDYFVEFSDSLGPGSSWQTLPGAPHNGGTVTDFATNSQRFYRVRSVPNGS